MKAPSTNDLVEDGPTDLKLKEENESLRNGYTNIFYLVCYLQQLDK